VIKSLKEILAWQRGEIDPKVIEVPDPMPPVRVKAIRKKVANRSASSRSGLGCRLRPSSNGSGARGGRTRQARCCSKSSMPTLLSSKPAPSAGESGMILRRFRSSANSGECDAAISAG
jgi:hypothetical protein